MKTKDGKVYVEVLNVRTQKLEDFQLMTLNDDFILKGEDGTFLKFPITLSKDELMEEIKKHNDLNKGQVLRDQEEIDTRNAVILQDIASSVEPE